MAGAHPAPKDTDFHSPFLSQLAPAASQHLLPASLLHGLSPETAAQHLVSAVVQPSTSQPAIRGHAYRGVTAIPSAPEDKRWRATINNNGKTIDIGGFRTEVEAATAYDEAARRLHGERARLNFPSSGERSSMGRSQYRGISWQAKCQKWEVRIKHEGKMRYVGVFADEEVAAAAWDIEALRLRGVAFRNLNFLDHLGTYVASLAQGKSSAEGAYEILGVTPPEAVQPVAGAAGAGHAGGHADEGSATGPTTRRSRTQRERDAASVTAYGAGPGSTGTNGSRARVRIPLLSPTDGLQLMDAGEDMLGSIPTTSAGLIPLSGPSSSVPQLPFPGRTGVKRTLEAPHHLSPRSKVSRSGNSTSPNSGASTTGPILSSYLGGGLGLVLGSGGSSSHLMESSSSSGHQGGGGSTGQGAANQLHRLLQPMEASPAATGLPMSFSLPHGPAGAHGTPASPTAGTLGLSLGLGMGRLHGSALHQGLQLGEAPGGVMAGMWAGVQANSFLSPPAAGLQLGSLQGASGLQGLSSHLAQLPMLPPGTTYTGLPGHGSGMPRTTLGFFSSEADNTSTFASSGLAALPPLPSGAAGVHQRSLSGGMGGLL